MYNTKNNIFFNYAGRDNIYPLAAYIGREDLYILSAYIIKATSLYEFIVLNFLYNSIL